MPSSNASDAELLFLRRGFSMISLSRPRGPITAAAGRRRPAGHQAEEALGERDHRHARGNRPVGAVQRHLKAAADPRADAVDEGERRARAARRAPRKTAWPSEAIHERPVPRSSGSTPAPAIAAAAPSRSALREIERLAGHPDRRDLARRARASAASSARSATAAPAAARCSAWCGRPVVQRDQREPRRRPPRKHGRGRRRGRCPWSPPHPGSRRRKGDAAYVRMLISLRSSPSSRCRHAHAGAHGGGP